MRRFGILVACLFLVLLSYPAVADRYELDKDVRVAASAADTKTFVIDFGVGELEIRQEDRDDIEVKGEVTAKGGRLKKVEAALEEARVVVESGETTTISLTEEPGWVDYSIDLKILIPRGTDLDVHLGVGELEAILADFKDANFQLGVGELQIDMPNEMEALIEAHVRVGEVYVGRFDEQQGESRRKHLVGAFFDGAVGEAGYGATRSLSARTGVGSVEIRGSAIGVQAEATSTE